MTDRYAVFGNPIGHSKSPQIHTAFAEQTQQALTYEAICAPLDNFAGSVAQFINTGGRGLNVTIPFKQEAWDLAEQRSARAELAGAVNTLYVDDEGRLCGDNTDGIGMVRDIITNQGWAIKGKRVLVLGAGGAVRGVLEPLLKEQPAKLVLANRTQSKAEQLAEVFTAEGEIQACGFEALAGQQFDLVINGTAASLQGEVPPLPDDLLAVGACCYDMMYAASATAFCRWAQAHGARSTIDGLGMLVEQAAESFRIWRGMQPATRAVINTLRTELSA